MAVGVPVFALTASPLVAYCDMGIERTESVMETKIGSLPNP